MAQRRYGRQLSAQQNEILINFMEAHPYLAKASGSLTNSVTAARKQKLWGDLAELLNEAGPAVKTLAGWKSYWRHFTSSVRSDAADAAVLLR